MSKLSTLKQEAYKAGKKKNWAQAIMLYEQILEQDKNNPTAINELGDLCLKGDESQRAVRYFLSAASKYRTTGLLNNAVAIYKKILRHDTENLNAHWYLSETRASQGLLAEGENHAVHFLDNSESVSGDIKEIFLKRCQKLFELYPQSRVILSRLSQIFRLWSMSLEAARADCLVMCMDFAGGKEEEARKGIDDLTAQSPEVMNYPEFTKWNELANPGQSTDPGVADFGSVSLEPGVAAETQAEAPPAAAETSFADVEAPAGGGAFGDLNLDSGPAPTVAVEAPLPAPPAPETPAPDDSSPLLYHGDPASKEKDDDGCFSLDGDEVEQGADFEELIAQASVVTKDESPDVDFLNDPLRPPSEKSAEDDPAGAFLLAPDRPTPTAPVEEKVDLLAQMLDAEGPEKSAAPSDELATITSEIGAVVGGGDDDDADRLYEMGMVYLEMGLFDQACDSFETAAVDEKFSIRAHEMWGITLQRADRYEEAITVLTNGLEYAAAGSREYHGLKYHMGLALEKTDRNEEAVECFATINDADPTFLDVGRRLAKLTTV